MSEIEELKIRNKQLCDALKQAIEAFDWLGNVINENDIATEEDEEYTTPRITFARKILKESR